jgi:hypothetical protein
VLRVEEGKGVMPDRAESLRVCFWSGVCGCEDAGRSSNFSPTGATQPRRNVLLKIDKLH